MLLMIRFTSLFNVRRFRREALKPIVEKCTLNLDIAADTKLHDPDQYASGVEPRKAVPYTVPFTRSQRRALYMWRLLHRYSQRDTRSDFDRGMYFLNNQCAHAAPVTAMASWSQPFGGDVKDVIQYISAEEELKSPHPLRYITLYL